MKVAWDYTQLAAHYDKRADYSGVALDRFLVRTGAKRGTAVADVGAGTGKLAIPLAKRGLRVEAVEPNNEMRKFGMQNTSGLAVAWHEGTAENTHLSSNAFGFVTFGSSFNVVDQAKALTEVGRILQPHGWFACLWNHRDLDDPIQSAVENVIKSVIPDYRYGARREDPSPTIAKSGLFQPSRFIEERFEVDLAIIDYMDAWHSHATLQRQAGRNFTEIIDQITQVANRAPILKVPYFTRIWYAQRA